MRQGCKRLSRILVVCCLGPQPLWYTVFVCLFYRNTNNLGNELNCFVLLHIFFSAFTTWTYGWSAQHNHWKSKHSYPLNNMLHPSCTETRGKCCYWKRKWTNKIINIVCLPLTFSLLQQRDELNSQNLCWETACFLNDMFHVREVSEQDLTKRITRVTPSFISQWEITR